MTVAEALATSARRLAEAGLAEPALDAELLLRHVSGTDRATLLADPGAPLDPAVETRLLRMVERRAARVPLQHLTGIQAFWRHDFVVTPDVLIPRPETEILVEAALEAVAGASRPVLVDVGTGSGCIALSLAAERPDALVLATDISAGALAVARRNALRLGLESRVRFLLGDLLEGIDLGQGGADLIVSNPPYVAPSDLAGLAPEVRDHEPSVALVAPGDAFSVYRRLAPQAARVLAPGGRLLLEIGMGMEAGVRRICEDAGLGVERVLADLRFIPRTLVVRGNPAH